MATIVIGTEVEDKARSRWSYDVTVTDDAGGEHRFDVTLGWSDYDLWSRGRVPPSRVVEAAFRFLLANEPVGSIMARFDCSVIRRYFPQVDRELPGFF